MTETDPNIAKLDRMLQEASILEHQLLVVYLYTIFSLKSGPDDSCSVAEWEAVRRWYSKTLMIARQEMEHLSFVQSIRIAIGLKPYFARPNFYEELMAKASVDEAALEPVQFPIVLQPFSINTIKEYICIESPSLETLQQFNQPIPAWCFEEAGDENCLKDRLDQFVAKRVAAIQPEEAGAGTIEELYHEIRLALLALPDSAFVSSESQPNVVSEYQIFLFPITDKHSAVAAVDLITQQGEGSDAVDTSSSHYRVFTEILREYEALLKRNPHFKPAWDWKVVERAGEIDDTTARQVFSLFNDAYWNLCAMLMGFYYNYSPNSNFHLTLGEAAFAPFMTMIIRPLFEILAQLPIDDSGQRTGPTFYLTPQQMAVLKDPDDTSTYNVKDLRFFVDGMVGIRDQIAEIQVTAPDWLQDDLEFMRHNVHRLANNLTQIFNQGLLPELNPNES